jgi:hypothetical protein
VELQAMPQSDPNDETAEAVTVDIPEPPKRWQFTCPCGADLVATPEMYDQHTRCGMCQTVMLVNSRLRRREPHPRIVASG